jgi:hypothetical protein
MLKNSKLVACVFFFMVALTGGQTKANTYLSFNAAGFWSDRSHDVIPLIADVTIDTSSGVVSNASFEINSPAFGFETFTNIISQGPNALSPYFDIAIQSPVFNFGFGFPGVSCTATNGCHDTLFVTFSKSPSMAAADLSWMIVSGSVDLIDANLIPGTALSPVSPVPLPAALPLFATGLGVLNLLCWCRKRRILIGRSA